MTPETALLARLARLNRVKPGHDLVILSPSAKDGWAWEVAERGADLGKTGLGSPSTVQECLDASDDDFHRMIYVRGYVDGVLMLFRVLPKGITP